MILNSPDTNRVSFISVNPTTDYILTLDSAVYGPPGVGILMSTLVTTDAAFWIQPDADGIQQLCTTKVYGKRMNMTYLKLGMPPVLNTVGHTFVGYENNLGEQEFAPRV